MFLRAVAPYRPFRGSSTVGAIACTALASAGVDRSGRNRGAHVFRHSAATGRLRAGASFEVVATLLRHRSLNTTAVYAKGDVTLLAQVVQPWIEGGAKCR